MCILLLEHVYPYITITLHLCYSSYYIVSTNFATVNSSDLSGCKQLHNKIILLEDYFVEEFFDILN